MALQFATLAEFYHWSHDDMMRLTSRQIVAYHRQIARLRAAADLRQLRLITAPHTSRDSIAQLQRELIRDVRGVTAEKPEMVIRNNAQLRSWLDRGGE